VATVKENDMTNFTDVIKMYDKFGLVGGLTESPKLIQPGESAFRLECLREELSELNDAYVENDLPKIADALVDLAVFVLGTAVRHNLPWEQLFDEVMRANNDKQVGNPAKERNGAGWKVDLVKPEGWVGPDIEKILLEYGWKREV